VISGLKASLHNPNVSEAAKASAVQRLQELESSTQEGNIRSQAQDDQTEPSTDTQYDLRDRGMSDEGALQESPATMNRKIGGYKATLKNPRVSPAAKKHAQEALEQSNDTM